ncbi:MAG: hypothetical protein ABIR36_05315 [Nitrospiraceae bacterium]
MNYRIYCWRKPLKRIQVLPTGLSSKYPESLQPSFVLILCWKILQEAETISLALAAWWQRQIQIDQPVINDPSERSNIPEPSTMRASLSKALTTSSQARFPQVVAQQPSRNCPASRFEAFSTGRRSLRLSSPRDRDLGLELTDGEARLVEGLLPNEKQLTDMATRILRLQHLIHDQTDLLAVMAQTHESPPQGGPFSIETTGKPVEPSRSSERRKVRNLFRLSGMNMKRFPRNRDQHSTEPDEVPHLGKNRPQRQLPM